MMRIERVFRLRQQYDEKGKFLMKKLTLIIAIAILLSGLADASDFTLKVKGNYFSPSEKAFKDIYGGGWVYGGEANFGIWKNLKLWVGTSFFSKKGELSFTGEETKVRIIPIGGGVKYVSSVGGINYYSGIGINYYLYKETNPIGDASKGGFGIVGIIGSFMKVTGGLIIDLYINYSYCKMKPADYRINIGGFEAGIGIGYEF